MSHNNFTLGSKSLHASVCCSQELILMNDVGYNCISPLEKSKKAMHILGSERSQTARSPRPLMLSLM